MLKKYSSNQHVDLGFTYHIAFSTPMCQARRSATCFTCGWGRATSSCSCLLNVLLGATETSSPYLIFNYFFCLICVSLTSVDVMYMTIMAMHMSMHVDTMRMVVAMSCVNTEFWIDASCRGMLVVPPQRSTGGVYASARRGGGGEHIPPRGSSGGHDCTGIADEVGTSRHRVSRGGRHGDKGCTSDAGWDIIGTCGFETWKHKDCN